MSLNAGNERLNVIEGSVPNPIDLPVGCYFADRCNKAMDRCFKEQPYNCKVKSRHHVACFLYDDLPHSDDLAKAKKEGK